MTQASFRETKQLQINLTLKMVKSTEGWLLHEQTENQSKCFEKMKISTARRADVWWPEQVNNWNVEIRNKLQNQHISDSFCEVCIVPWDSDAQTKLLSAW